MEINIKINIEDKLINRIKSLLFKNKFLVMFILAVTSLGVVYASTIIKPHTFSDGNVIYASEINENFDTLYNKVNELSSVQASLRTVSDQNNELGKILSADLESMFVISTTGYIYQLKWDGSIKILDPIGYSGADCTGTAYYNIGISEGVLNGKSIIFDGTNYFIPKSSNADGSAYFDKVNEINYQSYFEAGTCTNYSDSSYLIELQETTKSIVGLPNTITPPFNF